MSEDILESYKELEIAHIKLAAENTEMRKLIGEMTQEMQFIEENHSLLESCELPVKNYISRAKQFTEGKEDGK